jgi:hypothetical protein
MSTESATVSVLSFLPFILSLKQPLEGPMFPPCLSFLSSIGLPKRQRDPEDGSDKFLRNVGGLL